MPKLPRASSSAESNAGAPIRPDGGVFCTDFQSCLQRRSLSALQVDNDCGTHSAAQGSQVCHCGEAEGRRGALSAKREEVPLGCNLGKALPNCTGQCRGAACRSRRNAADSNGPPLKWQRLPDLSLRGRFAPVAISGRQLRFRRGFPVIHPGTARLPRRFAPRNDNSGASTILSATCTNCQFSAGRGMPLPYNARLETSCNFTLSTFHFPLAPCRTDNDRPHPDRRGRSFSVYLPYRRSYIVFMRRRRWASSAVSRPGCSRQLQLRSLSVPGVFMRASAPRPR